MLKVKVKASAILNLTDARYFAAREVTWLGFPLGGGDVSIDPAMVKAMIEWVDGVQPVGEFNFAEPEEILQTSEMVGLDTVQVGMFTSKESMKKLAGLKVIKEVVITPQMPEGELEEHLTDLANECEAFLLSFTAAGISWQDVVAGIPFKPSFLRSLTEKFPIILDIDIEPEELDDMLGQTQPYGLSFSGGEEEKVGFKSFDELDELLDVLEIPE